MRMIFDLIGNDHGFVDLCIVSVNLEPPQLSNPRLVSGGFAAAHTTTTATAREEEGGPRGKHGFPRETSKPPAGRRAKWGREDSNLRRLSRRVYSPFPLAARAHPRERPL